MKARVRRKKDSACEVPDGERQRERLETLIRKGKEPGSAGTEGADPVEGCVSEAAKGWSDNRIIEALETSPSR